MQPSSPAALEHQDQEVVSLVGLQLVVRMSVSWLILHFQLKPSSLTPAGFVLAFQSDELGSLYFRLPSLKAI